MTHIRTVIAGVAAAAVLGACSSGAGTGPAATPAPASHGAAPGGYTPVTADQTAIATVFRDHNTALLARDFAKACSYDDSALNQQLVASSAADGGQVSTCEDALAKIYTNPDAVVTSDGIARTAKITDIQVAGDTATVTWLVQADGKQSTAGTDMRRIAGDWRLSVPGPAQ